MPLSEVFKPVALSCNLHTVISKWNDMNLTNDAPRYFVKLVLLFNPFFCYFLKHLIFDVLNYHPGFYRVAILYYLNTSFNKVVLIYDACKFSRLFFSHTQQSCHYTQISKPSQPHYYPVRPATRNRYIYQSFNQPTQIWWSWKSLYSGCSHH